MASPISIILHQSVFQARCPSCRPNDSVQAYPHTHTTILQLSGLFRDNLGELVPEGTFRNHLDFMGQRRITQADTPTIHLDCWQSRWIATPSRLIGDPISAIPPFLCRMPFLAQPCQFWSPGPIEGEIFWGNEFFTSPLSLTPNYWRGVTCGIYRGIYGIYMPAKFGHPQCPNVGDSRITHIWTLGMPTGLKK